MASTLAKLACVFFLTYACMVVAGEAAMMTCNQIEGGMAPCLGYLTRGGTPTPACCTSLRSMVNSATTTVDRQNACKCLKQAAAKFKTIVPDNAAKLPSYCNVNIPYKISINTNCDRVY